jgi:stearoyl-CoA desaturase (delta-9 desaturase)
MAFLDFFDGGLLNFSVWQLIAATFVLTHVTIAAVTIYLHRSQAHRSLDVHPVVAHFFRLWLWLTTGMQTRDWVAIHRKHHAKCETPDDPHSPQTRGIGAVLRSGAELYRAEARNQETITRFGHGTPNDWLELNVYERFRWHGCGVMLVVDVLLFGAAGITVWAIQMMWIPITAAGIINGIGHFWGYRNFESADASANIVPWGILIGGEELHNNHHTYPTSARLSNKWYEFDLGWTYIRILSALGLAKVYRIAPVARIAGPRPLVDVQTLQAVINNRYDLLAKYARGLQKSLREEIQRLSLPAAERRQFARLRRWLRKGDMQQLPAAQRQTLHALLARSRVMQTLVDMRTELALTWEKSAASREQMLVHLQGWIARAEASGIAALQDAALRIRSYKTAFTSS